MLSFKMREGDDAFFGHEDDDPKDYRRLVLREVGKDSVVLSTSDRVIIADINLPDVRDMLDVGFHGIKVAVSVHRPDLGEVDIGFDMADDIIAVKGYKYRKARHGIRTS